VTRLLRVVGIVVLATFVPAVAFAYLGPPQPGHATAPFGASAATMPVGTQPAASVLGRNVELRWVPSRFSDGDAVAGYDLVRRAAGADAIAATIDCAGAVDPSDGEVHCSENDVPLGSWTYAVTPREGLWKGSEGLRSSIVNVVVPTLRLTPTTVVRGGTTTASVSGFPAGASVVVHLDAPDGAVVAPGVTLGSDGTGQVVATIPPGASAGTHVLWAREPSGTQASALVEVTTGRVNSPPVAVDDDALTGSGTGVNINVLANDSDPDGDVLHVSFVAGPGRGTTSILADGRVRYVAAVGFTGVERFTYEITDGQTHTARAQVTVTVADQVTRFELPPGGTLQSGGDVTLTDPVAASVTVPGGGPVTIAETSTAGKVLEGWSFVGTAIQITAPPATVESPLKLQFRVAVEALPPGGTLTKRIAALQVFRDGKAIGNCRRGTAATTADPDPCMTLKSYESWTNDVVITILSSHASEWSFALPVEGTRPGYRLLGGDGGLFDFGDAGFFGSRGGETINAPMVGLAATPSGKGYWLVAADGGVFAFGDAPYLGSLGGTTLAAPIVAIAATPSGDGYWLVGADGGVFAFGDAEFQGGMAEAKLTSPIVGLAATASSSGYWLVAADGGLFAFGDAPFEGSLGDRPLNAAVVGMAATSTGRGYWLVAADGGVFVFGDAAYAGSLGDVRLNAPVVGLALADGGYWLVASDGGVFSFGGAPFLGSMGGVPLAGPVRGIAAD
jgi:hypothetical protein